MYAGILGDASNDVWAQALAALAHVLQLRGKIEEARETLARELAMRERKRNLPGARTNASRSGRIVTSG